MYNDQRGSVADGAAPNKGADYTLITTIAKAGKHFVRIYDYYGSINDFYGGTGAKVASNFIMPYQMVVTQ